MASTGRGQQLVDGSGVGAGAKTLVGGLPSPRDRPSLARLRLTSNWLAFGSRAPHGLGFRRAGANELGHKQSRQSISRPMHSDIDA